MQGPRGGARGGEARGGAAPPVPPIPPVEKYLEEAGYHLVRQAKEFEDLDLSDAAAGFVSYRPITMLLRRLPFRIFVFLVALFLTLYTVAYGARFRTPEVGEDLDFDLQHFFTATYLIPAVMTWSAPLLATRGMARGACVLLGIAMLLHTLMLTALTVPLGMVEEQYTYVAFHVLLAILMLPTSIVMLMKEDWWWKSMIAQVIFGTLLAATLGFGFRYTLALVVLGPMALWLTVVLGFLIWRSLSLRRAYRATKPDQERYDGIWEPIRANRAQDLRNLAIVVNARRHHRVMQPFYSLDMIFQRAYSLNDWYQQIVEGWAFACGARALGAPVKSLSRTLEKIHRSYRGRIPPVIDLVRAAIVVDDIAEVEKVLEYVLQQAHAHQVKNRFDLLYDGEATAGYRDVNCHLSFGQLLGTPFEGFVFELQIHYAPILALKNDQGHVRYITLRNLRGD